MIRLILIIFLFVSCSHDQGQNYILNSSVPKIVENIKINSNYSRQIIDSFLENGYLSFRADGKLKSFYLNMVKDKKNVSLQMVVLERSSLNIENYNKVISSVKLRDVFFKNSKISFSKKLVFEIKSSLQNIDKWGQISFHFNSLVNSKILNFAPVFKVASLNALNFWDSNPLNTDKKQMYLYDIFRPEFSNWYLPKVQQAKEDNLIIQLKLMGLPEIVGIQEIESANGNVELFKKGGSLYKKLTSLGYRYFYIGNQESHNPVALTTAFISKIPGVNKSIDFNSSLRPFNDFSARDKKTANYTTRDMQVFEINVGETKAQFINNHWRSQGCSSKSNCRFSESVRVANAEVLKNYVGETKKLFPLTDFILLGDFNNEYWMPSLAILGSSERIDVVQNGSYPTLFYNLWFELPLEDRWEVTYSGRYSNLSHFMIDSNLFDSRGLQYVKDSFQVVGHKGKANDMLVNSDGNPYRWQMIRRKTSQLDDAKLKPINKILKKRSCKKNSKSRRCRVLYHEFVGKGFTDHLPLVAEFSYLALTNSKITSFKTSYSFDDQIKIVSDPQINTKVKICSESDPFLTKKDLEAKSLKSFFDLKGKCIKLNLLEKPMKLFNIGLYKSNYLFIAGKKLGISLIRSFDPREVVNGRPVGNSNDMDPLSNMCYARKVLQGTGGEIEYAFGRIGVLNGIPTLMAKGREDIKISNLPLWKRDICRVLKNERD